MCSFFGYSGSVVDTDVDVNVGVGQGEHLTSLAASLCGEASVSTFRADIDTLEFVVYFY